MNKIRSMFFLKTKDCTQEKMIFRIVYVVFYELKYTNKLIFPTISGPNVKGIYKHEQ